MCGQRREDDPEDSGDHRLELGADQPHQRAGGEQGDHGQQDNGGHCRKDGQVLDDSFRSRGQQHDGCDRSRPRDHRNCHGEDADVLGLWSALDLLGALLTPLGSALDPKDLARKKPLVRKASCRAKAPGAPVIPPPPLSAKQARTTPEDNGRGESADKTLGWDWKVEKDGSHRLRVFLWNGRKYEPVVTNLVQAQ